MLCAKVQSLVTQLFIYAHCLRNLHRKALTIEWDSLEQPTMTKVSMPNLNHHIEGCKSLTAMGCKTSVPDFTNAQYPILTAVCIKKKTIKKYKII